MQYGLNRKGTNPHEVAESVRNKLWEICDDVRRSRAVVPIEQLPQARLAVPENDEAPVTTSVVEAPPPVAEPVLPLPELAAPAAANAEAIGERAVREGEGEGEGDEPFRYQLRDVAAAVDSADAAIAAVLSDDELNLDLSAGMIEFTTAPAAEVDDSLLTKTVRSNLELAQRYGALDEQRLLLERKVQELVDVAQQTVHDLNRPLSAVRLMLSTLDKGYLGELSDPVRQAVQNGLMATHQMERLVRDLLDSSRLDHDGMQLAFDDVDLTLVVAEVLRTLRYEIEERDVRVRVEPMPVVKADAWALTKVFMNLIGNAINYGPTDRPTVIRVSVEDDEAEWRLQVVDNGIGIPAQDHARLFRRFERGSNTGGISGTGLGLHIVKELVQGHGGQVTFTSEVGCGTTFVLHLPKAPVLAEHSPLTETAARADL